MQYYWWRIAIVAVYMVVLHVLAGCAIRQWWRGPPCRVTTVPAESDSSRGSASLPSDSDSLFVPASDEGQGVTEEDRKRISAEELLAKFSNELLSEMCRVRRLPYTGTKSELVNRFMASPSRATNKQLAFMSLLAKRDYRLKVEPSDVDSKVKASVWIDAAMGKTKRA